MTGPPCTAHDTVELSRVLLLALSLLLVNVLSRPSCISSLSLPLPCLMLFLFVGAGTGARERCTIAAGHRYCWWKQLSNSSSSILRFVQFLLCAPIPSRPMCPVPAALGCACALVGKSPNICMCVANVFCTLAKYTCLSATLHGFSSYILYNMKSFI